MALWLAVAITVVASTSCSVGKALQKEATRTLPALSFNAKTVRQYLQSRVWLAGLGADLGGAVLQIASFAMAPVSLVQPVSGVGLVGLAVYSHLFLKERLAAWEWVAVALAGLGTIGLGATASGGGGDGNQPANAAGAAAAAAAKAAAAAAGEGGAGAVADAAQQLADAAAAAGAADQAAAAAATAAAGGGVSMLRMLAVMALMLLGVAALGAARQRHAHRGRSSSRRGGGDKAGPALYGLQAGACFGLSAASCRIGFLLGRLWVLAGLGGSVALSSSGFVLQTCGLKEGSTVVVCTCAAVASMVMGVAVGILGLGEALPEGWIARMVRLASWACILTGVAALSGGAGGLRELAALLLGRLPPGAWRALPVPLAVRLKAWTSHRVELPELTSHSLPPLPALVPKGLHKQAHHTVHTS